MAHSQLDVHPPGFLAERLVPAVRAERVTRAGYIFVAKEPNWKIATVFTEILRTVAKKITRLYCAKPLDQYPRP